MGASDGEPLTDATVYVVKYSMSDDPKVLEIAEDIYPQDSVMIVKGFTKTDADGNFVYTLDEPGIWNIVVFGKGVMERSIFILPVFESFPPTEEGDFSASPEIDTTSESPSAGLFTTVGIIGLIAVLLIRKRHGGLR